MRAGVAVNGVDLGVAGRLLPERADVSIKRTAGWWDGVTPSSGADDATVDARTATVTLNVGATTRAGLDTALQALARLVPPGVPLVVTLDRAGDRALVAERTSWRVTMGRRWAEVEIGLGGDAARLEARFESRAHRVVVLDSADGAPTPLPIGTLPVWPRVVLTPGATGSATNPTLTLTDLAGRVVPGGSITLAGAITGAESVEIDMARRGIWTRLAADGYAPVFAGDWRSAGDYLALDPADGDAAAGIGPAAALTCTAGSARAQLDYALRWDV